MLTEKEIEEYREQAEKGRKAQTAKEFVDEYVMNARVLVLHELETTEFQRAEDAMTLILFLRVLRNFEVNIKQHIDRGEIAERRLNEDGE